MVKPYAIHGGDRAGPVDLSEHETFEDALEALKAAREKYAGRMVLTISNTDRCDYCTVYGYDDGLTDDEREALECL